MASSFTHPLYCRLSRQLLTLRIHSGQLSFTFFRPSCNSQQQPCLLVPNQHWWCILKLYKEAGRVHRERLTYLISQPNLPNKPNFKWKDRLKQISDQKFRNRRRCLIRLMMSCFRLKMFHTLVITLIKMMLV